VSVLEDRVKFSRSCKLHQ